MAGTRLVCDRHRPGGPSGAVLGDLPPITLGLPTGVANEFGR